MLQSFSAIIEKFISIDNLPPVNRIAFGATTLLTAGSHEKAYTLVSKFLPPSIQLAGAFDFVYQINRRREVKLGTSNLIINRLSKWSVIVFTGVFLQIGAEVKAASQVPQNRAVRLELDMNTVPMASTTYSKDEAFSIFKVLKENAIEIAERGDIP